MTPLPRDWHALGGRLANWTPPQGAFDPLSGWSLHYARHALVPEPGGAPNGGLSGTLSVEQKPEGDTLRLKVIESVITCFSSPTTTAEITCAKDALLTPRRWSLSIRWQTHAPSTATPGELDQDRGGRSEGGDLVLKAAKERRRAAPERWTSYWSLFAAVPRLPFAASSVLTFDLLEDLELLKPGQRLAYLGPQPVKLGEKALNLHVFEQTGHGVLPWRWWLDDQHRVLLAAGGRRAYLLDAGAKGGVA